MLTQNETLLFIINLFKIWGKKNNTKSTPGKSRGLNCVYVDNI